jgi:prepilin-type processing-associated H-X9-DG protein
LGWKVYLKDTDFDNPSQIFVFLDGREDSVNTGTYATFMKGYPDPSTTMFYQDLPASYHLGAGGFSFADGHSEIKKWKDSRTFPKIAKNTTDLRAYLVTPNNQDIVWIQERATVSLEK